MAKYVTVEVRLNNDVDVYSDNEHQSLIGAVKGLGEVLDARVVGVSEGPDPEKPGDAAAPDDVATHYDAGTGEVVSTEG